ncbi:uncharacterized protein FIBRA_07195 [Fibroporia radiculosa]|uniref:Uncharacterized protein n=1 Tax=Fibroporia radiculosa TaxID=599839 RepID=J4I0A9_9APHY|nr:uncharacterized protein FIBRA_07195 [Fibroporia radiculosa]CCM04997.1 predicted protein [Fibroporia radiculosa]
MAGANYMGGKRNAARARVKDTAGRAQKSYFGKQRLGMLAKCLNKSHSQTLSGTRARDRSGLSDISLAHAQQHSTRMQAPPEAEPLSDSSGSARNCSGKTRRSKILSFLDTSEPIFIRAEMERIRKLPNLAGLTRQPESSTAFREASLPAEMSFSPAEPARKRCRISQSPTLHSRIGSLESSSMASNFRQWNKYQPSALQELHVRQPSTDAAERGKCIPNHRIGSTIIFLIVNVGAHLSSLIRGSHYREPQFINQINLNDLAHFESDFEPIPLDSSPANRCMGSDFAESGESGSYSDGDSLSVYQPERYKSSVGQSLSPEGRGDFFPHLGFPIVREDSSVVRTRLSDCISSDSLSPHPRPWLNSNPTHWGPSTHPFSQRTSPKVSDRECHFPNSTHRGPMIREAEGSQTHTPTPSYRLPGSSDSDCICQENDSRGLEQYLGPHQFSQEQNFDILLTKSSTGMMSTKSQNLVDALGGKLFENCDPWRVLDDILDLHGSLNATSRVGVPFYPKSADRRNCSFASDNSRRGVGYKTPPTACTHDQPHLPVNPKVDNSELHSYSDPDVPPGSCEEDKSLRPSISVGRNMVDLGSGNHLEEISSTQSTMEASHTHKGSQVAQIETLGNRCNIDESIPPKDASDYASIRQGSFQVGETYGFAIDAKVSATLNEHHSENIDEGLDIPHIDSDFDVAQEVFDGPCLFRSDDENSDD